MRQHKFRVYDGQNDVMVYNVGIDPAGIAYSIPDDATEDCTTYDYYPDDEPMSFTGLKDKNGVDIYEGDIIKWGDHCGWCSETPVRIAEVKFNPDIQFHSQVGVFKFGQFAYQDTDEHIEVIGNVHQNPELLEVK